MERMSRLGNDSVSTCIAPSTSGFLSVLNVSQVQLRSILSEIVSSAGVHGTSLLVALLQYTILLDEISSHGIHGPCFAAQG